LVDQWSEELVHFGYAPNKVYSEIDWYSQIKTQISKLKLMKNANHLCIVTTNDSFKTQKFNDLLKLILEKFEVVLIGDEVHNIGADTIIKSLPQKVGYRLGLSATPARNNDNDGTKKIIDYFGDIIFKFSLKDAIDKGFLTKYNYYPYVVYLDIDESRNYYNILEEFKGYTL
jgi:superfamily II DNA or RNA helicase